MSDRVFSAIVVVIIFFMVVMAIVTARGYFDCRDDGGKYVRGMFMYECLERNE